MNLHSIARRFASLAAHVEPLRMAIIACYELRPLSLGALEYELPRDKLVLFLYNPFGRALIARLLANVAETLRETPREIHIVYYNPLWADVFDASTSLDRRFAARLPYDPGEIGYGPDESDAVVIWQNRDNPHRATVTNHG